MSVFVYAESMHIVHIASELAPLAKVGGLADVVLGLARELSWKGHHVDIILPKYDCMDVSRIQDLAVEQQALMSYYDGGWYANTVWTGRVEGLRVYFIEPQHPRHFFHRGCFYGCDDDIERFLCFSRAAIEFVYKRGPQPDILHLHDWQTAAIAPLFHEIYAPLGLFSKVVLTIHNMAYQGKCATRDLDRIGLNGSKLDTKEKLQDNLYAGSINLVKGGIVYSHYVTTVSPSYAKETKTAEGGMGLEETLQKYSDKYCGVLNGIDYSFWNPEIDTYLPAHFSSREKPLNAKDRNTLDVKAYIKNILRDRLSLEDDWRPLVGSVLRLVPQKGLDLLKHTLKYTLEKGGQFVILGTSPIPEINDQFHEIKKQYADHPHVHLALHHLEELAHLIYAASDMFIVPSLFEPCGLTQMIALKYGAVPIVRKTGGLADTIFDVDTSLRPLEETNGYSFDNPDSKSLECALDRAFSCWFHEQDRWRKLMIRGMNIDFSWNLPSNQYLEIYAKIKQS